MPARRGGWQHAARCRADGRHPGPDRLERGTRRCGAGTGVSGGSRTGSRSATSAAVPTDFGQRHQALVGARSRPHSARQGPPRSTKRHRLDAARRGVTTRPRRRALDAAPPEHQGAAMLVRELLVRVKAPLDPHVATGAGDRQVAGSGQGDRRRHREEAADADPRAIGAQEERARSRSRRSRRRFTEQGGHGRGW